MTLPAERILARLKGHVIRHSQDWSTPISPRLVWLWDNNPGRCPHLSDDPTASIMSLDETNPLGKLYGWANAVVDDPAMRAMMKDTLPGHWYGIGISYEGWGATLNSSGDRRVRAAITERAVHLLPDRYEVRDLVVADREGRTYQAVAMKGGPNHGEVEASWWTSGEGNPEFQTQAAVERIAASFAGFLAKRAGA